MGRCGARTEPTPVSLPYGDAYLHRLACEHSRLTATVAVFVEEIEKREAHLVAGLASRNLTSIDLGGLTVRRIGRTGIRVD